ncbi:MAG: sigma-70 family RNA polymerase sigma factor [Deltaproteobacteria bacterium]|nr:sigma-70 family RNA polymerase sigma factor [Deltaproteobacteria bacterium]
MRRLRGLGLKCWVLADAKSLSPVGAFKAGQSVNIIKIAGCSRTDPELAARGQGANPARRFAVAALRKYAQLTQRELGEIMKMSESQVSNVEHRLNFSKEPICTRLTKLEERYVK